MSTEGESYMKIEMMEKGIREKLETIVEYLTDKGIPEEMAINMLLDIAEDMLNEQDLK